MRSARCSTRRATAAPIEIDGGVDRHNIARVVAAGARIIVAGSAIFNTPDPERATRELKAAAARAPSRPRVTPRRPPRACASATPKPIRWGSSTTRTTSCGSRSAAPICCAQTGWTYRDMEADGYALPVIEAHCAYRAVGEVRRRARGPHERRAAVAGSREVQLRGRARRRQRARWRPAAPCTRRSTAGRPLPAARSRARRSVRMKALVTGVRRLHRIDARRAAARRRRRRRRHRLLHRLLSARDQGAEPAAARGAIRGSASSSRAIQDADLPALLADRTHVFHLAAQAGVRKSWGTRLRDLHGQQHRSDAGAARGVRRASTLERLVYASSSSVYGDRRRDADARRRAAAAGFAVRRLEARGRTALLPVLRELTACRPSSLRYFTVYGPRQRPGHGVPQVPARDASQGEPITVFGDGEQTRDFTFVADAVSANVAAATRGVPGACTILEAVRASRSTTCSTMIGRVTGRPPIVHVDPAQKGDMRHTYADTSLARADLGLRRPSGSNKGSPPNISG